MNTSGDNSKGSYKRLEHSEESSAYYIIPKHKIAIPVIDSDVGRKYSSHTIQTQLGLLGDFELPTIIQEYPIINHYHLKLHFSDYTIIPLLKTITVYKPKKVFSGHEQLAIEKQRRRHFELIALDVKLARDAELKEAEIEVEL